MARQGGMGKMRDAGGTEGKYRVAMAGRSVMGHWFKFWNFPEMLSRYAIYFPWPIPYRVHTKGPYRLEYVRIVPPNPDQANPSYGKETLSSLCAQVGGKRYDAVFFKFCFVDFRDRKLNDEITMQQLFDGMKTLISDVHAFAREEKAHLILGNALPVLKPGKYAQRLRREYNAWIGEYAGRSGDIAVFDLFGLLADDQGSLRTDLARNPFDPHLNKKAYSILEKELDIRLSEVR
jgi:hypothetical protein